MRRYESFICDSSRWDRFSPRPGDVIVTTPPKCGTTWMQMCCLLLVHGDPLPAPLGELSTWLDQSLKPLDVVLQTYEAQTHRRVIKTHTPLDGLPTDDEIIYVGVARDPRDVALSMADHMANMDLEVARRARVEAGFEDVVPTLPPPPEPLAGFEGWVTDDGPVEALRSTLRFTLHHLTQLWSRRHEPNVLLFHYADLCADLPGELRRLADGLGIDVDDATLSTLAAAATFDAMRADADNLAPNAKSGLFRDNHRFFAEARHGSWRAVVDDDALARYDARVDELTGGDAAFAEWLHR
jgi:aryl sulfotransferase